jgi:hypothetical protein
MITEKNAPSASAGGAFCIEAIRVSSSVDMKSTYW